METYRICELYQVDRAYVPDLLMSRMILRTTLAINIINKETKMLSTSMLKLFPGNLGGKKIIYDLYCCVEAKILYDRVL